jgi:endoglucanase
MGGLLSLLVLSLALFSCSNEGDNSLQVPDPPSGSSSSVQRSSSSVTPQNYSRAHEVNRKLGRGVNLGNAFDAQCRNDEYCPKNFPLANALASPQSEKTWVTGTWDGCWSNPIRDDYFDILKEGGFESIRLPVRWAEKASDISPYIIPASFMASVKATVDKAITAGFPVVLNMHHFNELYDECSARNATAQETQKEKFVELWRQIADKFKDYDNDYLVFEILNEPRGRVTSSGFDALLANVWPVIRETNPNRTLMINPAPWGHYSSLTAVTIPNKDSNVILSGHYYLPQNFTHQGEDGNPVPARTIHWGTEAERQELKNNILRTYNNLRAKYVGTDGGTIPINIGEFGVTRQVPEEAERVAWLVLAVEEFEKYGFSWHYWAFPSAGNYDGYCYEINSGRGCSAIGWKQDILNALIPQEVP